MKTSLKMLVLASVVTALAFIVQAQQFEIKWSTFDGGGGTSTGGVYSVSGTVGQTDAGAMSGGNFTLVGGFWSFVAVVQTPGAPMLKIIRNGSNVIISWPDPSVGFNLQLTHLLATSPAATTWNGVTNSPVVVDGEKKITLQAVPGNSYFRLIKP